MELMTKVSANELNVNIDDSKMLFQEVYVSSAR